LSLLLGIDTGGTYTDAVLYDETRGVIASAKALTTKHDLSIGIRDALEAILKPDHPAISLVSLSTTLATNAIVEGHGSPICLLLLGYPSDVLELAGLGKALGKDPVVFIAGGHQINGDEQMKLDLESARQAIEKYTPQVAAFAISGYFAVHNPSHELAVRDLVRELSGLPVTCGHELTSNLHAPRRALTVALNARLIPFLQQLILSVQNTLLEKDIQAPLMVVKGDGSLVEAQVALERPVETILSGPAASVVGARHLSGEGDVLVVDMGGTTTDIALLEGSRPALSRDGALVGGWHTMVEAIAVHTSGLGGDSEVRFDEREGIIVGPQRVVPLSLLAFQYPEALASLRNQVRQAELDGKITSYAGQFALRQRSLNSLDNHLDEDEAEIWARLEGGPLPLDLILSDRSRGIWLQRALDRLTERGLLILSGFTPTDTAHVLGFQATWVVEAASLGASLWCKRMAGRKTNIQLTGEAFCQKVMQQVSLQLGRAALSAVIPAATGLEMRISNPLRRMFVDQALQSDGKMSGLVEVSLTLKRPLVAVGAPASTYFPPVAASLHTRLNIPEHAEVANAVGAVVGSVVQTVRLQIRQLADWKGYRVHLPEGVHDFNELDEAASFAEQEAHGLAEAQAIRAGAQAPQIKVTRQDHVYHPENGAYEDVYLGTEVSATAVGRPRIAG
jgi:N-methylhydantoinase A/oxoprolinase/acetone carboxylase beta subunit